MAGPGKPVPQEYPEAWSALVPELIGCRTLCVAGYEVTVEIGDAELKQVYLPLLGLLSRERERAGRIIAGLAGIPGSGKSTLAAALADIGRKALGPEALVVVGMDGWHFPNAVLDQRTTRDQAGRTIPLRRRKGAPETFDVTALADSLRRLRTADEPVSLPVYDRRRHDPVAGALTVSAGNRIVLVEGNYLLSKATPWNEVSALLKPRLFLECDSHTARQRIIRRHVRGGLTEEQAVTQYEANDQLNTDTVLVTACEADVHIRLGAKPGLWR